MSTLVLNAFRWRRRHIWWLWPVAFVVITGAGDFGWSLRDWESWAIIVWGFTAWEVGRWTGRTDP